MKKFLILITVLFLILASVALAANTTKVGISGNTIEIIPDGSTDWVWNTDLATAPRRVRDAKIAQIIFYPSAASDQLIIHDNGIDEATFFDSWTAVDANDARTITYPPATNTNIVIDASDCTFDTAGSTKILIILTH